MTTDKPQPDRPDPVPLLRQAASPWWHLLTFAAAVLVSLGVQQLLPRQPQANIIPATVPIATAASIPTAVPLPTSQPEPTTLPPASGITRQELLDLRAEDNRIWAAIYLSRAISQLADAEASLRANDLERTDQLIIAVDDSLSLAYQRTPELLRDPIAQLRRDASALREDLYLRPEGLDLRLARLRQTLVTLIAERR